MSDLPTEPQSSAGQRSAWEAAYRQDHPRWRGPSDLDLTGLKGTALELGCGDGKTAVAMIEYGLRVVGLDLSIRALSTLSNRTASENLALVQGDALALPFKDEAFDSVTTVHLIDHLLSSDRRKAVNEIARVLKPDGTVVGRFFSREDMRFGKGKEIEPNTFLKGNDVLNHYFSEEEVLTLFTGFSPISIKPSKKATKFPNDSGYRSLITAQLRKC